MKKTLLLIIGLFLTINAVNAQKYYKSLDIFAGIGANVFNNYAAGIGLTYGKNFNDYISLGLGVDCRYVNDLSSIGWWGHRPISYVLVPVHARFKANFGTKSVAPFFMFDAGYAYNFWNTKSVVLLEPSLGLTFNNKVTCSAGVILYPAEYTVPETVYGSTVDGCACTLCIRMGFFIE